VQMLVQVIDLPSTYKDIILLSMIGRSKMLPLGQGQFLLLRDQSLEFYLACILSSRKVCKKERTEFVVGPHFPAQQ